MVVQTGNVVRATWMLYLLYSIIIYRVYSSFIFFTSRMKVHLDWVEAALVCSVLIFWRMPNDILQDAMSLTLRSHVDIYIMFLKKSFCLLLGK